MKKCPKCGELCNDDAKFCKSCSFSLPENPVIEGTALPASVPANPKEILKVKSILGLAFAGTYIVLSLVYWAGSIAERNDYGDFSFRYLIMAVAAPVFFVGLIFSIIGTATSKKHQKRNKLIGALGITGSVLGLIGNIAALLLVFHYADLESKRFSNDDITKGEYTVNLMTEDPSKAQAVCYYWDGDPGNNRIKPEFCNDGTEIVRLNNFTIEVEESKDYFASYWYSDYKKAWGKPKDETYMGVQPGTLVYFKNITFDVEIGKNIEHATFSKYDSTISPAELAVQNPDGSITFYRYFYNFIVDPDHPVYYAKDGVLYYKKSNKKVDAFYEGEAERFTVKESVVRPDLVTPTVTEAPDPNETAWDPLIEKRLYGSGPEKIDIWSYSTEIPDIVGIYMKMHPEFGEKYSVECTVIATDGGAYEEKLDNAIVAGGDSAPDIYVADADFVVKYTQGDMSAFASKYKDLGIDVDKKITDADIAKYSVEAGTRNGDVVALGYRGTSGAMIYNSEIAKEVFGTDDPDEIEKIVGAGSGSWDKFIEASVKLKNKGYAAISGPYDIWYACEKSADTPWAVNGELKIDPKREEFLDLGKTIVYNGLSNGNGRWSEGWYADMQGKGEQKVFAFFGPAWFINYIMAGQSGGNKVGEGTYGQWRVCAPPVGFFWGGTWILANNNSLKNNKEGVAELIEWITLDASETGLQYIWANGLTGLDGYYKDAVVSGVVMSKSDGSLDFCGRQNIYPAYLKANNLASAKSVSQYDSIISGYYEYAAEQYFEGKVERDQAIKDFKKKVNEDISL